MPASSTLARVNDGVDPSDVTRRIAHGQWRATMKTLGLIGVMSWESTAIYYRHLNEIARERLGGLHSTKLLLWSFDFADVADRQQAGDWEGATALMIDAARRLEAGGAEALVICTNTMHRMASALET